MRDLLAITAALADENRVRALCSLHPGELCVCQLTELLALAPSTVSKHLSILKQARLVDSRKDGRWIYYRLPGKSAPPAARTALRWLFASLENDPTRATDLKRLKAILKQSPEDLCRRQMGKDCCPPTEKVPLTLRVKK